MALTAACGERCGQKNSIAAIVGLEDRREEDRIVRAPNVQFH